MILGYAFCRKCNYTWMMIGRLNGWPFNCPRCKRKEGLWAQNWSTINLAVYPRPEVDDGDQNDLRLA